MVGNSGPPASNRLHVIRHIRTSTRNARSLQGNDQSDGASAPRRHFHLEIRGVRSPICTLIRIDDDNVKIRHRLYEGYVQNPEHNVTQGIPNLLESTWVPQNDMLREYHNSLFTLVLFN